MDDRGVIKSSEAMEGTGSDHVQTNYELCDNEHNEHDNSIESLCNALHEARLENERLQSQLSTRNDELERVCDERDQLKTDKAELRSRLSEGSLEEIEQLREALSSQTEKAKRFWRLRCEQMLTHDELIEAKEDEIALLHAQLVASRTQKARSTDSRTYLLVQELESF